MENTDSLHPQTSSSNNKKKFIDDCHKYIKIGRFKNKHESKVYYIAKESESDQLYFAENISSSFPSGFNKKGYFELLRQIDHPAISKYFKLVTKGENLILISKYYSKDTLDIILQKNSLNKTQILIILYGLASGLKFLTSFDIYVLLQIDDIQLDASFFPKISFYGLSSFKRKEDIPFDLFPELIEPYSIGYHCVLFYSFIVFQLLTKKNVFASFNKISPFQAKDLFVQGKRPLLSSDIPEVFRKFIDHCWEQRCEYRWSFNQIIDFLRNNEEIISDDVDKESYYSYIKYIDNYNQKPIKMAPSQRCPYDTLNIKVINLVEYSKQKKIGEGHFGQAYQIQSKETGKIYSAKESKNENCDVNIYNEAVKMSQLDHPGLLKFIGYSNKNFEGENKSVIITEYMPNGSLQTLLDQLSHELKVKEWDKTHKMLVIYGIASFMSYLHSKDIVHRDLKPRNILLDDYLLPHLSNFCYSVLPETIGDQIADYQRTARYCAPEIFESEEYSEASDVYSFSMILYEILSGERPFNGDNYYQVMEKVMKGERPLFNNFISPCFRQLIEKCWSQDPSKRPSFDEIAEEIQRKEFLAGVDQDIFACYLKSIEFHDSESIFNKLTKVDLSTIYKEFINRLKIELSVNVIDIRNFRQLDHIGEGNFGDVYKVQYSKDNRIYAAKISKESDDDIEINELVDLVREVNIISKLNHPCILNFIGYSQEDFDHENSSVIITELASNGSLKEAIEKANVGLGLPNWNETTKLIIIYGIASSLSYIHSLNIIHRDLKPENVLLDDELHPKLADFGLSKEISEESKNMRNPLYVLKGTPYYCSPEILDGNCYSKSGDIYAFGLIVYEILTTEKPFKNIQNYFELVKKVCIEKVRPVFDTEVLECYRSLVDRCSSYEAENRPTINDILESLRNDRSFLENGVDENIFVEYVDYIDNFFTSDHGMVKYESKLKTFNENNTKQVTEHTIKDDQGKIKEKTIDESINECSSNKIRYIEDEDYSEEKAIDARVSELSSNKTRDKFQGLAGNKTPKIFVPGHARAQKGHRSQGKNARTKSYLFFGQCPGKPK